MSTTKDRHGAERLEQFQQKCEAVLRPELRQNALEQFQQKCEAVLRPELLENKESELFRGLRKNRNASDKIVEHDDLRCRKEPPQPRISVILPTFNRAAYVRAAIDSVLAQTLPVHEFIVVDDGSDDGTHREIERYSDRLRYIHQANQGKVAAIEAALAETTGDLVWIMDDDDIASPHALAALAEPFRHHPDLVLSYGNLVKFTTTDWGGVLEGETPVYPTGDPRPFLVKIMEDCFITGHPCVLARRSAYEAMMPFDRSVTSSVDYYFHLAMALRGPAAFVDEIVLLQRQHAGARGPAAERYAESERVQRWKQSDRVLIERMLDDMTLAQFDPEPGSGAEGSPLKRRACLIQRASIAARKQLWERALRDLSEAFAIEPDVAMTTLELYTLARLLGCRYGIEEVHRDPAILSRLRKLGKSRPRESTIPGELGRPLLHQMKNAARTRNPREFLRALRLWVRLMDVRSGVVASAAISRRVLRRAARRAGIGSTPVYR